MRALSADDREFLRRFLADPLVRIFTNQPALRPLDIAIAVETIQCVRADVRTTGDPWEYELVPAGFRRGDEFFMLLLTSGEISPDDLKPFFPGAGKNFNPVNGTITRRIPTEVEVRLVYGEQIPYEVGGEDRGGWPHFATHPELLASFARYFRKEGVQLYRWYPKSGRARKEPFLAAGTPVNGHDWLGIARERMLHDGEMPIPDKPAVKKP